MAKSGYGAVYDYYQQTISCRATRTVCYGNPIVAGVLPGMANWFCALAAHALGLGSAIAKVPLPGGVAQMAGLQINWLARAKGLVKA